MKYILKFDRHLFNKIKIKVIRNNILFYLKIKLYFNKLMPHKSNCKDNSVKDMGRK